MRQTILNNPLTGIDTLLQNNSLFSSLRKRNIALITNQNALTQTYRLSAHALCERLGKSLRCILTPEHGWSGLVSEGVKIGDGFEPHLKLPLFSLYGGVKAYLEFFRQESIDCVIIDLQDVGVRCYTYVSTCAQLVEALSLEVIVCDRPNPLGPQVKGPMLDPQFRSIVGYVDTPFQHGQTMGQLLAPFTTSLTVIPCTPYHKPYAYPWVPPSPNLPSWESVLLYPGLVLLEGTNVSEGRGTSLPFTCLGAPNLDHRLLVEYVNQSNLGIHARPITFTPQAGKFMGQECQGAHLLLIDSLNIQAFELGIQIISFLRENYDAFEWLKYDDKYFIDNLLGTDSLRKSLKEGGQGR